MKAMILGLLAASLVLLPGCKKIAERNEQADDLLQKVTKAVAAGEGAKVFDEMGASEFQAQVSRQEWLDLAAKFQALGEPKEFTRTGFNIKTENGITTGEYDYDVKWANGSGTVKLRTKVEGDVWKVLGVTYDAKLASDSGTTDDEETPPAPGPAPQVPSDEDEGAAPDDLDIE